MRNFVLPDWERADGCYIHFGLRPPEPIKKTLDSYLSQDVRRVHNVLLADSSESLLDSSAQKRLNF